MNREVTCLTKDAFEVAKSVYENEKPSTIVLQFLDGFESKVARLSDGVFWEKVAIIKSKRSLFDEVKHLDIVECVIKWHVKMFVLLSYKIIYTNVKKLIGHPVDFNSKDDPSFVRDRLATNLFDSDTLGPTQFSKPTLVTVCLAQNLLDDEMESFVPINLLTPSSRQWAIKARVMCKSKIINFKNGYFFKCNIFDNSAAVQTTFFNHQCDRFYDLLEEGKCYIFMNGDVKTASEYGLSTNEFIEIDFKVRTSICPVREGDNSISEFCKPLESFNEVKEKFSTKQYLSVAGIIQDIGVSKSIKTKDDREVNKQIIRIVDQSEKIISVSLWNHPLDSGIPLGAIVVFQNVKKIVFNEGIQLSTNYLTKITACNSVPPSLRTLQEFRERLGREKELIVFEDLSKGKIRGMMTKTLEEITEESNSVLIQPDLKLYFQAYTSIKSFGTHLFYDACWNEDCFKKVVVNNETGVLSCPVHGDLPTGCSARPRFFGTVELADHSRSLYVTFCTDEVGEEIFGLKVEELKQMILGDTDATALPLMELLKERAERIFKVVLFPSVNSYNGVESVRYFVKSFKEILTSTQDPDELMIDQTEIEDLIKRTDQHQKEAERDDQEKLLGKRERKDEEFSESDLSDECMIDETMGGKPPKNQSVKTS